MQNHNSKLNIVFLILILCVGGFSAWVLYQNVRPFTLEQTKTIPGPVVSPVAPAPSSGKKPTVQKTTPTPTPAQNPVAIKTVREGEEFTIRLNEKVIIQNSYGNIFTVTGFYNHPCPTGSQCIWSGLDVFYKIKTSTVKNSDGTVVQQGTFFTKDKIQQDVSSFPYSVQIKDSDYKSYAKVVLQSVGQNTSGLWGLNIQ